ncbi:hypothetical protein ACFY0P_09265 [Streptomyces sp. NPDC001714]|uniref:hypothetical protein n=1 Tax=Streptomyces sp. NPDC001714 TaxID=3364603 RepID=UPI0036A75706
MDPLSQVFTDEGFRPLWETVAWNTIENAVLIDGLDVSGLSDDEVIQQAFSLHLDSTEGDNNGEEAASEAAVRVKAIAWVTNHEPDLKRQGDEFLREGRHSFATLFYATWIEHWVNRIILYRAIGSGAHPELATALIRSSRMELKLGRIWTSLGMPKFPKELARQVTRVMESRNAFVHYKWPSVDEEAHSESIKRVEVEAWKAQETVTALTELEDSVLYDGRSESLKATFRKNWYEKRRQPLNSEESIEAPQASD